jgi:hypothetical protein
MTTSNTSAGQTVTLNAYAPTYNFPNLTAGSECSLSATDSLVSGGATSSTMVTNVTIASSGAALTFVPLSPTRICDTRAAGPGVAVNQCNNGGAGGSYQTGTSAVAINSDVPANAVAISANITITNIECPPANQPCWGYLNVASTSSAAMATTTSSVINWTGNVPVVTNAATIPLNPSGEFYVGSPFASYYEQVDIIIDVNGYYIPAPTGGSSSQPSGLYISGAQSPGTPDRICDTRAGVPPTLCNTVTNTNGTTANDIAISSTTPITLNVSSALPTAIEQNANISAVELSVQAINSTANGQYISITPGTAPLANPPTSYLNPSPGHTAVNRVIVPVTDMSFTLQLSGPGVTDVIIDMDGFFTAGTSSAIGGYYIAAPTPFRIIDTRSYNNTTSGCSDPNNSDVYGNSTLNGVGDWYSFSIGTAAPVYYQCVLNPGYLPSASADSTITDLLVNTTIVNTTSWGYDSVLPLPNPISSTVPATSDTVWSGSNEIKAEMDILGYTNNGIEIFNGANPTTCPPQYTSTSTPSCGSFDVLVDVYGWFNT